MLNNNFRTIKRKGEFRVPFFFRLLTFLAYWFLALPLPIYISSASFSRLNNKHVFKSSFFARFKETLERLFIPIGKFPLIMWKMFCGFFMLQWDFFTAKNENLNFTERKKFFRFLFVWKVLENVKWEQPWGKTLEKLPSEKFHQ